MLWPFILTHNWCRIGCNMYSRDHLHKTDECDSNIKFHGLPKIRKVCPAQNEMLPVANSLLSMNIPERFFSKYPVLL